MPDILEIIPYLEGKINDAIEEEIANGNTILDNGQETYRVKLYLDAGEYKEPDFLKQGTTDISLNRTNKFITYANGMVSVTESTVEGVISPILTYSTMLELLIPLKSLDVETGSMELVAEFRKVIDNALAKNEYKAFDGFNMGIDYTLAGTGARSLNYHVGDSVSLYCYIVFSFVAEGVNSSEIKVFIEGTEVNTLRQGFSRVSVQEANVDTNSQNGVAKNITTSTLFTLTFDKPSQKTAIDAYIDTYLYEGEVVPLTVKVQKVDKEYLYTMVLSDVSENTEKVYNASQSVTMVEYLGGDE
jgi:hypothetical protein